jgi:hypothetical protein
MPLFLLCLSRSIQVMLDFSDQPLGYMFVGRWIDSDRVARLATFLMRDSWKSRLYIEELNFTGSLFRHGKWHMVGSMHNIIALEEESIHWQMAGRQAGLHRNSIQSRPFVIWSFPEITCKEVWFGIPTNFFLTKSTMKEWMTHCQSFHRNMHACCPSYTTIWNESVASLAAIYDTIINNIGNNNHIFWDGCLISKGLIDLYPSQWTDSREASKHPQDLLFAYINSNTWTTIVVH